MNQGNDQKAKGIHFTESEAAKIEARLLRRSADEGECRVWMGGRGENGYGVTTFTPESGQRRLYTHRAAWAIANGSLPDGVVVRHKCDNPPCINPEHLLIGSTADNNADTIERFEGTWRFGAWVTQRGTGHRSAKLDPEKVRTIRDRHARGETQASLAAEYGISAQSAWLAISRRTWKHVD